MQSDKISVNKEIIIQRIRFVKSSKNLNEINRKENYECYAR